MPRVTASSALITPPTLSKKVSVHEDISLNEVMLHSPGCLQSVFELVGPWVKTIAPIQASWLKYLIKSESAELPTYLVGLGRRSMRNWLHQQGVTFLHKTSNEGLRQAIVQHHQRAVRQTFTSGMLLDTNHPSWTEWSEVDKVATPEQVTAHTIQALSRIKCVGTTSRTVHIDDIQNDAPRETG